MSPSYESIKSNVQTLKWAEETYFCIMNSVKKPTNVHKDSLPLSTQAFNRRYACLYKRSHLLHFSKICLYLSLRFNELIKTTKHTSFWFLFLTPRTSLTSAEMLSSDFHFSSHRTTIIVKLMNLLQTTAVRAYTVQTYQYTPEHTTPSSPTWAVCQSCFGCLTSRVFRPLMLLL